MATYLTFTLPPPQPVSHTGFSETRAAAHVRALAEDIGMRSVGTRGEKAAEDYILSTLNSIASNTDTRTPLSITVQRSSGSHYFTLMDQRTMKNYINVTNIIVHISCGPACDENAVLVNAHYDTQLGTVGACDDGMSVAVMLELASLVSKEDPATFRNSLILLFNGAEETLQDASHAFSVNHPLAKKVRAFINMEAMGNSGKEVLFQANSRELVEAYGKSVRRPHGTVSSNDLFKTGLIMSDTDYRQFVDYGNMVGIDLAIYQSSFVYHTMLDTAENIETGLIQHVGDNTLDLVLHLMKEAEIEKFEQSRDFIYFDLFDTFFFVYKTQTAHLIHGIVIVVALLELIRPAYSVASKVKSDSQPNPARSLTAFIMTTVFVLCNFVAAIVSPLVAGIVTQFVLNKPLMYFRAEWTTFALFGPISLMGIFSTHIFARLFVPTDPLDTPVAFERRVYASSMIISMLLILIMTWAGLGSMYLVMIQLTSYLVALWMDRFINPVGNGAIGSHFPINPLSYFIASFMPFFIMMNNAWCFLMLFVPLTGRMGYETPTDAIVGALVGLLIASGASGIFSTLLARCSYKWLLRGLLWSLVTSTVVLGVLFGRNQFDELHPKRVYIQYTQNVTSGAESILVAHADPVPLASLVASISQSLGNVNYTRLSSEENEHQYISFLPFTRFIEVYKFDFGAQNVPAITGIKNDPVPQVEVETLSYNQETGVKEVLIKCFHPQHFTTTLSFAADLVSWSFSHPPETGFRQHNVKHAGGYPANYWNATISYRTRSVADTLYLHFTGVEKNAYETLEPYSKTRKPTGPAHKQKAQRQWIWGNGYRSGQVMKEVAGAIESIKQKSEWTTEGYIAVDQLTVVV
ncbi:hypothetical protein HDU79_006666 [Rhizoclosmatium sp. JEL0117]|nr:hypothetical protein HDU79_006666 [Rhizoclosmatium sp. JEL0117]